MRRSYLKIFLFVFLLPLTLATLAAQPEVCPAIVQKALGDLGQNCDALDRNAACYGYNRVAASFNQPQSDDYFSAVSDRTPLDVIDTLAATPLDTASETWGIAVMRVQANVPNSLPGQAVVFVLMGDTEVRNDVSPADAFTPADPVEVNAIGNVNVRSGPSRNSNVIGSITNDTLLLADGRSSDDAWLRVLFNDAPGWVSRDLMNTSTDLNQLPVITGETLTPMQAFHVTTGVSGSSCADSPDVLVVQGPKSMTVNLTVNGAKVQIGSTVVFRSIQASFDELLQDEQLVNEFGDLITGQDIPGSLQCNLTLLMVLDGQADINDGIVTLPTGFAARSINCGGADRSSGFTTPWGGSRPLTQEDLDYIKTVGLLPPNILLYPIQLPTLAEIQRLLQLFSLPSGTNPTIGPAGGLLNCKLLVQTSPLGTMPASNIPFYWDAVPGATSYTVRVYDTGGALVGEYSVNAPTTTLTATPGGKDNQSWEVSAYVNGELACTSARVNVLRDQIYDVAVPTAAPQLICVPFPGPCPGGCTLVGPCGFKDYLCSCPP